MAVTASIKFVQGLSTPPAGEALIGVLTILVEVSNGDNSSVRSWTWEIIDVPPGSSVPTGVVASGDAPVYTFTPDVRGGYHFHLTTTDDFLNTAEDFRVFQVPETTGHIIPPFDATAPSLNFLGQLRGWAKYIEELLRFLLAGAGGGEAVIFDDSVPATNSNVRTNRAADQAAVDNTKSGITNLGSDTTGLAVGTTGDYSSIGGGNANEASGDFSTSIGGDSNRATADYATVLGGTDNRASGVAAVAMGSSTLASGSVALAHGAGAAAIRQGQYAHAGSSFVLLGDAQYGRALFIGTSANGVTANLQNADSAEFLVENGKAYALRVVLTANRNDAAGRAMFVRDLLVHAVAGNGVIDNENVTLTVLNGEAWALVVSAVGSAIRLAFTGTLGQTVRACATLEWTEVMGF